MQIYVTRAGRRAGPYSLEEVNRQLAAGRLSPVDHAWSEVSPGWKPVLSVPGVIMPGGASSTAVSLATAKVSRTAVIRYAGFWIRTIAFGIDCVILAIPASAIGIAVGPPPADSSAGHPVLALTMVLLMTLTYFAALWSSHNRATVGQKMCSLKVVDGITRGRISFLRAVGRCLVLWLGLSILLIGAGMIAATARKRGLHDLLTGTCVIKDQLCEPEAFGL